MENTTFQSIIRQNDSDAAKMQAKLSDMTKRIEQLEQENVELRLKSSQNNVLTPTNANKKQLEDMRSLLQEVTQLKSQLQKANETINEKTRALDAMKLGGPTNV